MIKPKVELLYFVRGAIYQPIHVNISNEIGPFSLTTCFIPALSRPNEWYMPWIHLQLESCHVSLHMEPPSPRPCNENNGTINKMNEEPLNWWVTSHN